jgi:YHS domain-containing protein
VRKIFKEVVSVVMTRRLGALAGVVLFAALLSSCGLMKGESGAEAKSEGVDPIYKFASGLALKGYDPVAYFNDGRAEMGSSEFGYEWRGATWYFVNENNRDLFMHDPEAFAPQYGGYCSWAVSHGYTAKGDPEAWKIVDGKLYVNYNKDVQEKWSQDISGCIKKGDENWPQFLIRKPEHKGD